MSKISQIFLVFLTLLLASCSKGPGQGGGLIGTGEGFGGNTPPTTEPMPSSNLSWSGQIAGVAPSFKLDACVAPGTGTGVAFSSTQTYSSMGLNDITVAFAFKANRQPGTLSRTMSAIFHKMDNTKTRYPFHCGLFNAAAPADLVGKIYCEQKGQNNDGRVSVVRTTSSRRLDDNRTHVILFSKTGNTFIAMADGDVFYYQTISGLTEGGWNTMNNVPVQVGSSATAAYDGLVRYLSIYDRGFAENDLKTYSEEVRSILSEN